MGKPILLLDIDGTINPDRKYAWPRNQWVEARAQDQNGLWWKIRAAEPVIQFFASLHEADAVDIRWHSTWQAASVGVGEALRLPMFPVQPPFPDGRTMRRGNAWKLAAVNFLLDDLHDVIWVDDDADRLWGRRSKWNVTPDPELGLETEHLHRIWQLLGMAGDPGM